MATGAAEDAETASYESSSSSSEDNTVLVSKKHRKKLQLKQQQREKEKGATPKASASSAVATKSPVASSALKVDHICGVCEKEGGDLYVCTGSCVSAYHLACLELAGPVEGPRDQWKCPHCVKNTHVCFHCKKLGVVNGDATAEAASSSGSSQDDAKATSLRPVVKCRALSCGKFYHQDCIATLPLARIAGSRFICPLHTCAACEQSGAKKEPVRCTRCPVAYHTSCLPRSGVLHLPGKRIICPKHEVSREESESAEKEAAAIQEEQEEEAAVGDAKKIKKAPTLVDILNMEESRSVAASSPRTEENDDAQSDVSATGGSSSKKHSKKDKKDKKKKKKKRKKDKEKKKDKDRERSASVSHRGGDDDEDDAHDDGEKDGAKVDKSKKVRPSVKPERRNTIVSDGEDVEIVEEQGGEREHQQPDATVVDNVSSEREARGSEKEVVKAEVASTVPRPMSPDASIHQEVVPQAEQTEVHEPGVKMEALLNPPSGDVKSGEESARDSTEENRVTDPEPSSHENNDADEEKVEGVSTTEAPGSESPSHVPAPNERVNDDTGAAREANDEGDEGVGPRASIDSEARATPGGASDDGDEGDYDSGSGSQSGKANRAGAKIAVDEVKDEKSGSSNRAKKSKKKKKGKAEVGKRVGPGTDEHGGHEGTRAADEAKWVQCDDCKKWRTVPKEIDLDAMPETWYCKMNTWNKAFASCNVPEEVVETKKAKPNKRSSISSASDLPAPGAKKPKLSKQQSTADVPTPVIGVQEDDDKERSKTAKKADKDSKKRKLKLKLKEKYGDVKWVQCENSQCGKWRVVPLSIDFDLLPSVWYCKLNTWAPELASCLAANPIEVDAYLSKSQSKKPSGSRPAKRLKGPEGGHDAQALSAVAIPSHSVGEVASKSGSKSSKGAAKSGTPTAHASAGASASASSSASNQSTLIHRQPSVGDDSKGKKVALEGVKSVVLEWAQCEKCNKWRKLPAHIKSSTLPDKWYCTMNHWDPARASCSMPQEEDQEPIDASPLPSSQNWYPMPGQVGGTSSTGAGAIRSKRGKLSYSELLYASTGQLRKTYTSESSTLSFEYEGVTYHRDDQYKGSSMYVSPLTTNKLTGENIEPQSETSKVSSIQFVAPGTQELADRVSKSILRRIDLRREFSITEIVDSVVTDSDVSVNGNNLSLSVITTAIAQLVSNGELEKVAAPRQEHHKPVDAASSTTILLGSLSSQPAYYRKVPKRPLKALKAWKVFNVAS